MVLVTVAQLNGVKVNVVLTRVSPAGKVSSSCVETAPGFDAGLTIVRVKIVVAPVLNGLAIVFVTVGGA